MAKTDDINTKKRFKDDFQAGELFQQWRSVYESNGYISNLATHRMRTVLKLLDSYKMLRKDRALDVGIGSGTLLKELAERYERVFGADFSIDMVQGSAARLRQFPTRQACGLLVADVEGLPIKNNAFDLVTCLGVLEYLSTDKIALAELYRILRPGGHLVLVVGSYHRLGSLFKLLKIKVLRRYMNTEPVNRYLTLKNRIRTVKPTDFRDEAIEAGFRVQKFKCFGGRLFGRYYPIRLYIPGLLYIGDVCLLLLKKPA